MLSLLAVEPSKLGLVDLPGAGLVEGLLGVGVLVSLGLCWLAYDSYRRWDEPGVGSFAAFVALLGVGGVAGGVVSLVVAPVVGQTVVWPTIGFASLLVWCVHWALFSLQYTGRYTQAGWQAAGLLLVPVLGLVLVALVELGTGFDATVLSPLLGGAVLLYVLGLLAVGIFLLFRTTYEYGHLSVGQGATLAVGPVVNLLLLNTATMPESWGPVGSAAVYVVSVAVPGVALCVALFWYDTFESAPAIGTIGERTITRELEDPVFVVDDCHRVIMLNEAATEVLGIDERDALGRSLTDVLGEELSMMRANDVISLETTGGTRRYDVGVSPVTDQHDRELGALFTLHDVTERELREQRLAVLNRVLRHNLRNKVDVLKSHMEALDGATHSVETVIGTADEIARLGESARAIDAFVSDPTTAEFDLVGAVEEALAATADRDVSVSLDLPESATVETNWEALAAALESAIENACQYADSTVEIAIEPAVEGYRISVADDGPGIPDGELASLDTGTETALDHGTGLGLWQLRWAVTTMGGELTFETDDGTTVRFTVPDGGQILANGGPGATG